MEKIEENPDFSMWKVFSETMPALTNMECPESTLQKLISIVKSKDFGKTFVCSHDSSVSYEEHQKNSTYYKTFTVWLLGRFFYLLSCEKLHKLHKEIGNAQLHILREICVGQANIYEDLTVLYVKSLIDLNDFGAESKTLILNHFAPDVCDELKEKLDLNPVQVEITNETSCRKLQIQLVEFVYEILKQNLQLYFYNRVTYDALTCLNRIIAESCFKLKLTAIDVCVNLLSFSIVDFPRRFIEEFAKFLQLFEIFLYDVYHEEELFDNSKDLIVNFFKVSNNNRFTQEVAKRIALFIYFNRLKNSDYSLIYRESVKVLSKDKNFSINNLNLIENIHSDYLILPLIEEKITFDWNTLKELTWKIEEILARPCKEKCLFDENVNFLLVFAKFGLRKKIVQNLDLWETLLPISLNYFTKHTCADTNINGIFSILGHYTGEEVKTILEIFASCLSNFKTNSKLNFSTRWKIGLDKRVVVSNLCYLLKIICAEYCTCPSNERNTIANMFETEIWSNPELQFSALETLSFFTYLTKKHRIGSKIFTNIFTQGDGNRCKIALKVLGDFLCSLSSTCRFTSSWNNEEDVLNVKFDCDHNEDNSVLDEKFLQSLPNLLDKFKQDRDVKVNFIRLLPIVMKHSIKFHQIEHTEKWIELLGDSDQEIREEFSKVFSDVIFVMYDKMETENRDKLLEVCFLALKKWTKKSLQTSDFQLQITLLFTIDKYSKLPISNVVLQASQLLLYFIMIPTSKHSLIAVNFFIEMAEFRKITTNSIYYRYRRELCESIVELCAINQALIGYNLQTSLEKISLMLSFYGAKDFVTQDCRYLLPFFVSLVMKMPRVEELINEIAMLIDTELGSLLAGHYGHIFLHVFLYENEDVFKKSISFVERMCGSKGQVLRKKNFQVIVNELLLNFHEKKERVLLALRILAKEDSDSQILTIQQIPEYLQPRFLGVLAYFDIKLLTRDTSKKKKVLLSLSQLLSFMGAKHITPLRFKILAMLQTALTFREDDFQELNCDIWNSFVRSCELDALKPQLGSIFVSILPLLQKFPEKINLIFRYLLMENEGFFQDCMQDLFFITEHESVAPEINKKIAKYLKKQESKSFKVQLEAFLKYLTHEMIEIRIYALKYLKLLLGKNREELDSMILGYNGVDPVVVELLDTLTFICREKDETFRIACGECIGELGAIEPTHLPRRYTQQENSFVFFLTEDAFIVNALNELIRAFQAEKNTQNMNKFALAIQEILKVFDISPGVTSVRKHLWNTFPESQKELMLPLLSSRYTIVQPVENINVSPIFGSSFAATFHTWIFNWTCTLASSVNSDKKTLLQVCLPSLKQNQRTMMQFLPHILLHALIEGGETVNEKVFEEFTAVLGSFNKKSELSTEILDVRPLTSLRTNSIEAAKEDEQTKQTLSAKVVFVLLDFLDRWAREWVWQQGVNGRKDKNYQLIKTFLEKFSKLEIAQCNYQCGEYPRSLIYFEEYIYEQPDELSNQLGFLAQIYAQLNESDGVAGVTALQQSEPSLEQKILTLEALGKLSDAAAYYESIKPPLKPHHIQGLVQCYLDLDNTKTALNFAKGAIDQRKEYGNVLFESQAEALWRLGQYEDLDNLLQKPEVKCNNSWGVQIGQAMLNFRKGEREQFTSVLNNMKTQQVNYLCTASLEDNIYQHGYSHVTRLHILNELQQVEETVYGLVENNCDSLLKKLSKEWELRLKVVQESVRVREPILCIRRIALEEGINLIKETAPNAVPLMQALVGEMWLLSAKTARTAGIHQQAYTYTLKAEQYAPPTLFIEKAKLYWLREEHNQAFTALKRGLETLSTDNVSGYTNLNLQQRKICAKAKLLIASYNESIANVDTQTNMHHYKEAIDIFKEWEKSLIYLAQYNDRVFSTLSEEEKDAKGSELQLHMINYFGKSLQYGTSYVYQSMPRMLSIWFDYGTRLLQVTSNTIREERKKTLLKMTKLIDAFLDRLPTFIFLTAFSQLVSRICHPQKEVYIELKSIIIKLLLEYPQQTLWMIISVIKSSYSVRSKRCSEILDDPRLKVTNMVKLIDDFTKLAEKLIELCNMNVSDSSTFSVSKLLRSLPRLLSRPDFSEIMIPIQKFRKLILPNPDFKSTQHNPFPNHYVHIRGIEDDVFILQSLQKPKRITLQGSDGKTYMMMLKPKDDLRKDFRLMEFNDIVNHLLAREAESRQKRLNIRLYSVAPLNEECGLIEWIPNLVGLRPILLKLYKQKGLGMSNRELKNIWERNKDSLTKKREAFTKTLLVNHPPILGEWFRITFPDVQGWLSARTAYIRTTAVISMVGYMLGLGDRHGENISFDSTNGDTVHVDFNCLFNKGETFEWPERVPFRLTHNMVAAMGPLGVEGTFRNSCATTLKVLRTYKDTLMSTVTPFVYDPLVSGSRNVASSSTAQNAERTDEKAMDHIRNIESRLKGMTRSRGKSFSIALSVEGQTNYLIEEAIGVDNLCQMYIGWGPYL